MRDLFISIYVRKLRLLCHRDEEILRRLSFKIGTARDFLECIKVVYRYVNFMMFVLFSCILRSHMESD